MSRRKPNSLPSHPPSSSSASNSSFLFEASREQPEVVSFESDRRGAPTLETERQAPRRPPPINAYSVRRTLLEEAESYFATQSGQSTPSDADVARKRMEEDRDRRLFDSADHFRTSPSRRGVGLSSSPGGSFFDAAKRTSERLQNHPKRFSTLSLSDITRVEHDDETSSFGTSSDEENDDDPSRRRQHMRRSLRRSGGSTAPAQERADSQPRRLPPLARTGVAEDVGEAHGAGGFQVRGARRGMFLPPVRTFSMEDLQALHAEQHLAKLSVLSDARPTSQSRGSVLKRFDSAEYYRAPKEVREDLECQSHEEVFAALDNRFFTGAHRGYVPSASASVDGAASVSSSSPYMPSRSSLLRVASIVQVGPNRNEDPSRPIVHNNTVGLTPSLSMSDLLVSKSDASMAAKHSILEKPRHRRWDSGEYYAAPPEVRSQLSAQGRQLWRMLSASSRTSSASDVNEEEAGTPGSTPQGVTRKRAASSLSLASVASKTATPTPTTAAMNASSSFVPSPLGVARRLSQSMQSAKSLATQDLLFDLPDAIWSKIFGFLSVRDRARLAPTCWTWERASVSTFVGAIVNGPFWESTPPLPPRSLRSAYCSKGVMSHITGEAATGSATHTPPSALAYAARRRVLETHVIDRASELVRVTTAQPGMGSVECLHVLPRDPLDGAVRILSLGADSCSGLSVWRLPPNQSATRECRLTHPEYEWRNACASPSGASILATDATHRVGIWRFSRGDEARSGSFAPSRVCALPLSPLPSPIDVPTTVLACGSEFEAVVGRDRNLYVANLETGAWSTLMKDAPSSIATLCTTALVSSSTSVTFVGFRDGSACIIDGRTHHLSPLNVISCGERLRTQPAAVVVGSAVGTPRGGITCWLKRRTRTRTCDELARWTLAGDPCVSLSSRSQDTGIEQMCSPLLTAHDYFVASNSGRTVTVWDVRRPHDPFGSMQLGCAPSSLAMDSSKLFASTNSTVHVARNDLTGPRGEFSPGFASNDAVTKVWATQDECTVVCGAASGGVAACFLRAGQAVRPVVLL